MKITLINHESPPTNKTMSFTDVIRFSIDLSEKVSLDEFEMNFDAEEKLKEICTWCSETFKENFIIIEHVSARIAGGWVDNSKGWKKQRSRVRRTDYAWQAEYELRCMSADATWFKMRLL